MEEILLEKVEHIEQMIETLNGKIDNFMGFEELTESEKEEVKALRKDVQSGKTMGLDEVFGK